MSESPFSPRTAAGGSDPSSFSARPENPPEKTGREMLGPDDEARGKERVQADAAADNQLLYAQLTCLR